MTNKRITMTNLWDTRECVCSFDAFKDDNDNVLQIPIVFISFIYLITFHSLDKCLKNNIIDLVKYEILLDIFVKICL